MNRLILVSFLLFLFTTPVQSLEVYVNNKPFRGQVAGQPNDLHLEAIPFFKQVGGDYRVFDSGGATFNGDPIDTKVLEGVRMVSARALVELVGGKYNYSPDLDVLDIYAFDPIGSAREKLDAVLRLPRISRGADFLVISILARHTLVTELQLSFIPTIRRIELVSDQKFQSEGGPTGAPAFAKRVGETLDREIQFELLVRKGLTPTETIRSLAWVWGATWASTQTADPLLTRALGEWASYRVLDTLTGPLSPETVLLRTEAYDEPGAFKARELVDIEKVSGVRGVLSTVTNN